MTPEQIDAMEAGPEIDELAARTVMGWKWMAWTATPKKIRVRQLMSQQMVASAWWKVCETYYDGREAQGDEPESYTLAANHGAAETFEPSTYIADTQRVWDEMKWRGWRVTLDWFVDGWNCRIFSQRLGGSFSASAPALELAMTKAALKAAGKET